ncbi:MarR family winged helix-turn-helix transcriptional regulator [Streptomyces sp. IMTB 2501]|uniref:MarR family winged helix-turn-helix transcriptional regulator n=1 Tax=Streptomyces sp. IMTB 2501 TaxID=1776340 RepID=UPI00211639DE|nr:MarR family winged helix-turn-helix transcriptional regulator [Streptomyces sp. IMTB 2501]
MTGHPTPEPDLGVLAAQVLFSVQRELFTALAEQGFDDIQPRAGAVLAHLRTDGIRPSALARASGQHMQVIGSLVDDLGRKPDPADRRAKLIHPTETWPPPDADRRLDHARHRGAPCEGTG